MSESQTKEYKIIVADKTTTQIEEQLNALAQKGWTLSTSYNIKNGDSPTYEKIMLILERTKS